MSAHNSVSPQSSSFVSGLDPVLVVGTGRCGSTLMSQMVREHPVALSVSELFSFVTDLGLRLERALPLHQLTGNDFWSILADPQPRQNMLLKHGLQMPEVVYPWDRGRFDPGNLPPIMQGLIPHLEPDTPDLLFDEVGDILRLRPRAPIADHYRAFFHYLAERFDRHMWVERSGGSLRAARRLIEMFPEAKVVHVVRDGRDVALSMSRHIGFRMALLCGTQAELLGVDPYESDHRAEEDDLDDVLTSLLPESFNAESFQAFDLDPALCGHYWSGEIVNGLRDLDELDETRLLTVSYERLLRSPVEVIKEFGTFMTGEPMPNWVETAASMVQVQEPRWTQLSGQRQQELFDACAPGFAALVDRNLIAEPTIKPEPTTIPEPRIGRAS